MSFDEFDSLWRTMTQALREPVLLSAHPATRSLAPETDTAAEPTDPPTPASDSGEAPTSTGEDRFHAWFDPGGDGKPEAIWTKPLHGKKQVRLSHRRDDFRRVFDAISHGSHRPSDLRDLVLRGHYLYTLMRHFGN